jgi:hypothetical protein
MASSINSTSFKSDLTLYKKIYWWLPEFRAKTRCGSRHVAFSDASSIQSSIFELFHEEYKSFHVCRDLTKKNNLDCDIFKDKFMRPSSWSPLFDPHPWWLPWPRSTLPCLLSLLCWRVPRLGWSILSCNILRSHWFDWFSFWGIFAWASDFKVQSPVSSLKQATALSWEAPGA